MAEHPGRAPWPGARPVAFADVNREASPTHRITTETELRAVIGEANDVVLTKISDRLHPITRGFIERSPFVVLATADAGGRCDVSPRGDPAGFVRIVDDTTLLIPERPGNKIADSLRNIVQTGRVGLLFVIPGITDTFRVNGRAFLTTDPLLMEPSAVEGQIPRLGIRAATVTGRSCPPTARSCDA